MKNLFNDEVVKRYSNVPLIVPVYKSKTHEYYSIIDLSDFDFLMYCLEEVADGESYITEVGYNFLKEVFGIEVLAELLYKEGWYRHQLKSKEQIFEWLKSWEEESKEYSNISPNEE